MSNYNSLKTTIDANIKQNGNQEITGQILNSVLNQMVTTLGAGYQFAGVATLDPATDPGTPDAKVFYIANGKGTYTNFGGINVTEDDVVVLYWDSSWHKESTGIAREEILTELGKEVATKQNALTDTDGGYGQRVAELEKEGIASQAKLSELAKKVDKKQDTLIAGDNIKIEENVISSTSVAELSVKITWSELKALRDNSQLVAGTWYRITDYTCTTTQEDTRSAGHPFDIIVVADDESTLNENAKACKHDGDTYFNDCKLGAWELKYCLDNDTNRFAWADIANGKGVVWWLKDEWNNECFYDFKNIQFKRYKVTAIDDPHIPDDAKAAFIYNEETQPLYFGAEDLFGNSFPDHATLDKANPMWVYRFTGYDAVERTWYDVSTKHLSLSAEALEFLANDGSGADTVDMCRMNREGVFVKEYFSDDFYYKGRHVLPNNVGYGIHKETWEDGALSDYQVCYQCNNTFGNDCYSNTFGGSCYSNTFGDNCAFNIFGYYFSFNTFGNSCRYNIFGDGCIYNIFGNDFFSNTFGNSCYSNTFGNSCYSNTFGNSCYYNTFGNDCYSNTFGNYLVNDTFGNDIQYIIIPTATGDAMMRDCVILNGTHAFTDDAKLNISFTPGVGYTQYAGLNSSGELKIWIPADLIN